MADESKTAPPAEPEDKKEPKDEVAAELSPVEKNDDEPTGADLIREAALDNAGRTDAEKRALDSALATFGFQTNQQINFIGSAAPSGLRERTPLAAHSLARVRTDFVHPPDYTAVRQQVLKNNFLLLSGRAGAGREHLATHILDALCDGQVDRLEGGRIRDLDPDTLVQDAGYVWIDVEPPVEAAHVDQMVEALHRIGARLIVVWPEAVDVPFQLEDCRYALGGTLDNREILVRHLQGDDAALDPAAEKLLADVEVLKAIAELGGVGAAAGLGRALRDVVANRCTLQAALAKAVETANWFTRLPEREDKAFALALASLDGLSFPSVVSGARRMDEMIQETEDPEHRSSIRTSARPARQLLAAVDASCRPGVANTPYGQIGMTAVESNRSKFPQTMLRTIWREFPYLQQVYLDWLAELVDGRDPDTRGRAAVATGLLAREDFDFIRGRLLDAWALSENRQVRRSAAVALRAPALDDALKDVVWDLLEDWATADAVDRHGRHHLRLTAATALGGPVGATDYRRALGLITTHLLDWSPGQNRYPLWSAVIIAMAELFGDGGSPQSAGVLKQLVAWSDDNRNGPRDVAIAATVAIAGQPATAGFRDGRQSVPLLRAVTADPGNLALIAYLWRLAINDRVMADTSVDALLRLVEHVEEGDETPLLRLVESVPETVREHRTLRYEFRQRAAKHPHPPMFDRLTRLIESLA